MTADAKTAGSAAVAWEAAIGGGGEHGARRHDQAAGDGGGGEGGGGDGGGGDVGAAGAKYYGRRGTKQAS